ncbi:MAG: HAD family phosphatase [Ktedonobacterales bacterium]|nr:HAD family phosphatase [Ktedonobacterales bacterium]
MPTISHGVIWDLDGVIIDSAAAHWQSWQHLATETGVTLTEANFRATFGMRNADIIPRYWPTTSAAEVQRLADRKEALYRDIVRADAQALPGALDLLRDLHTAGWHQALGSSAPLENIRLIIDVLALGGYLDAAVSGEDAEQGKPAPDIFLAAARALGLAPANCLVIEDAVHGVQAARAAGMRCIAVTNGHPNRELAIADRVVTSLTEVSVATITEILS